MQSCTNNGGCLPADSAKQNDQMVHYLLVEFFELYEVSQKLSLSDTFQSVQRHRDRNV